MLHRVISVHSLTIIPTNFHFTMRWRCGAIQPDFPAIYDSLLISSYMDPTRWWISDQLRAELNFQHMLYLLSEGIMFYWRQIETPTKISQTIMSYEKINVCLLDIIFQVIVSNSNFCPSSMLCYCFMKLIEIQSSIETPCTQGFWN